MDAPTQRPFPDPVFACVKCNQVKPAAQRRSKQSYICRDCQNSIRQEYMERPEPRARAIKRTASWVEKNKSKKTDSDKKRSRRWEARFCMAQHNAAKRGILFLLPLSDFIRLHETATCECCGVTLTSVRDDVPFSRQTRTLDRLDSAGPYSVWNCSVLCHRCNTIKSDASADDVLRVALWLKKRAEREEHVFVG